MGAGFWVRDALFHSFTLCTLKLVTFKTSDQQTRTGWLTDDGKSLPGVVDMHQISNGALPTDMLSFIDNHEAEERAMRAELYAEMTRFGARDLPLEK